MAVTSTVPPPCIKLMPDNTSVCPGASFLTSLDSSITADLSTQAVPGRYPGGATRLLREPLVVLFALDPAARARVRPGQAGPGRPGCARLCQVVPGGAQAVGGGGWPL